MNLLIAINFEEQEKNILFDHMHTFVQECEKGVFTKKENIHLSLVYVGETTRIGNIVEVIDSVDVTEFSIALADKGKFRRSGGEVYWLGIEKNHDLMKLQKILYRSLSRKGIISGKNDFKPHFTVSRDTVISEENVPDSNFTMKLQVKSISLMKRENTRDGSIYTEMYAKNLKKPSLLF